VSLRTDIHLAFDEVTPSRYGMYERIVRSALPEHSRPRVRFAWPGRLRGVMAMVAVLLLLVLAVGVLAGGRLYRDWNNFSARSTQLADLEARALKLPVLKPGQDCPGGPPGPKQGFGAGPVYGLPGPAVHTSWGTYAYPWLLTDRALTGVVLGRGTDLVTGDGVVFVGSQATGPVVGRDRIDGLAVEQHRQLLLDTTHKQEGVNPPEKYFEGSDMFVAWQVEIGLPAGAGWCVGFQFDGPGFSEVFVMPALGAGPPLN